VEGKNFKVKKIASDGKKIPKAVLSCIVVFTPFGNPQIAAATCCASSVSRCLKSVMKHEVQVLE